MFRSAVWRLTGWYLVIIMAISLIASGAIYAMATRQAELGLREQSSQLRIFRPTVLFGNDYESMRMRQLDKIEQGLQANLLMFNLLILIFGGGASYLLARRTLRPLEEAMEAQGRFTSDASHELRTPLTVMKSELEVALRSKSLSVVEAKELLQSNLEEVLRLEMLSGNLLKLSRYQAGEEPIVLCPVEASKVVTVAIDRVQAQAKAKQIKIKTVLAAVSVKADEQSLTELMVILLENAIKYSPTKTTVTVSAKAVKDRVELAVKDEGPGISAEDAPHIFERFYRADSSRSKNQAEGYGLGLALAEQIAQLHGSSIHMKSVLGKGAEFSVSLPKCAIRADKAA